jgi:phosphatidylglycerol:prolipoprotein diacylglycerol transferase
MRPILFVIPGWDLKVHSYGIMIFVACAAALMMAVGRARRERVDPDAVYELAASLFLGGVIGARVFYFIQHPEAFHHPSDLFRTWEGGNVFYGCILGGLTGSVLYWFRRPFPFLRMCDVVAPAVAIGAALGRIGCFLNGCCHGAVCDLPWAVCFPAGSHAWVRQLNAGLIMPDVPTSLPVHPTQLYSAAAGFFVLGLLLAYAHRPRRAGELMAFLMIIYPLTRWPIESLRSDEPAVFAGMTWSQNLSVALLVGGLVLRFILRSQPPGLATAVGLTRK